jgi:MFS family permease
MTSGRRRRGPLAENYPAAVALVVFALVPFLSLTASISSLLPMIARSVGVSRNALELTVGISDAAYAFGTVLAVQLAQHLPGRRLLLVYVSVFACAAVLAAWAPTGDVFLSALVVEGLCTSLMLIAAVPPLITGWPADKLPWTGAAMNLCVFGAVAIGPTIGGLELSRQSWRPLFSAVAAIAVLALVFSLLTYEDSPPQDQTVPWDWVAILLAGAGCAAAFFGASQLEIHKSATVVSLATLGGGVLLLAVLVIYQYRLREPLMPVKQLVTTLPLIGVVVAVCASAAAFGLMELTVTGLQWRSTPAHTAVLFLPEFGAAVATAAFFGSLFRTRFTPVLAFAGLGMLVAAAVTLSDVARSGDIRIVVGTALIGFGVGASVSPALFIAGFSLRSKEIQRIFALIELLRGVAAFLFAPILLYLAAVFSASAAKGTEDAIWLCLGVAAVGAIVAVTLFAFGLRHLQTPDLDRWQDGEPAWDSPPLLAALRSPQSHQQWARTRLTARPSGDSSGLAGRKFGRGDR